MSDTRIWLGGGFIALYYATLWIIGWQPMPPENAALIKDAMLQLGPPVGIIIGALFRSDRVDEQRAENTRHAFEAVTAAANAGAAGAAEPELNQKLGEIAQTEEGKQ